jgi:hypothetical protein
MGKTTYDVYIYSGVVVLIFGILGNSLVIISILRRKAVLKNNYYYLVLQLAICDLATTVNYILDHINHNYQPLFDNYIKYCVATKISYIFQVAGVGMMLIISVLRYRATVHPLKPAISRRKLKIAYRVVYIVGFIAGYGAYLPVCFIQNNVVNVAYLRFFYAYKIFSLYFAPTIFMGVVYCKIGQTLVKQNKFLKSMLCQSNPVTQSAPSSYFKNLRYIRNRRAFLVCFITVFCYGVGNIPFSVWLMWYIAGEYRLRMKYVWVRYFANVLRVAGSHSVNPFIYGMLDKKLLTFWTVCRKKKRGPQEQFL